jgi:hypothetical protein
MDITLRVHGDYLIADHESIADLANTVLGIEKRLFSPIWGHIRTSQWAECRCGGCQYFGVFSSYILGTKIVIIIVIVSYFDRGRRSLLIYNVNRGGRERAGGARLGGSKTM